MAIVGITGVTVALVDDNQKVIKEADKGLSDTGVYRVNVKDMGTKTANITGLAGTTTKVFGDNQMQDIAEGSASPAVAWTVNNLDFIVRNKLIGNMPDGKGGFVKEGDTPHSAMLIETKTVKDGKRVFFAFGNGVMTMPSQNIGTNTENQTREDDTLTFTALTTAAFKGQPYKVYYDDGTLFKEEEMMAEVFGGYTAPVTPAK